MYYLIVIVSLILLWCTCDIIYASNITNIHAHIIEKKIVVQIIVFFSFYFYHFLINKYFIDMIIIYHKSIPKKLLKDDYYLTK